MGPIRTYNTLFIHISLGFLSGIIVSNLLNAYKDSVSNVLFTGTGESASQRMLSSDFSHEIRQQQDNSIPYQIRKDNDGSTGDDCPTTTGDIAAKELYKKVRVLCWIMTSGFLLEERAIYVRDTWAKRCNKVLFISDEDNTTFPTIGLKTEIGRSHLTAKTMQAYQYVYDHHFDDADWFLKADDDSYIILENLRYMLSEQDTSKPMYFGSPLKLFVKQGYMQGGAGYVLSRKALQLFGTRPSGLCRDDGGPEDAEMGKCLEKLGVQPGEGRDRLNRTRFHAFKAEVHLHGSFGKHWAAYDVYNAQGGYDAISDYVISFHKVKKEEFHDLEFYTYHLTPYGIDNAHQNLNGLPNTPVKIIRSRDRIHKF